MAGLEVDPAERSEVGRRLLIRSAFGATTPPGRILGHRGLCLSFLALSPRWLPALAPAQEARPAFQVSEGNQGPPGHAKTPQNLDTMPLGLEHHKPQVAEAPLTFPIQPTCGTSRSCDCLVFIKHVVGWAPLNSACVLLLPPGTTAHCCGLAWVSRKDTVES